MCSHVPGRDERFNPLASIMFGVYAGLFCSLILWCKIAKDVPSAPWWYYLLASVFSAGAAALYVTVDEWHRFDTARLFRESHHGLGYGA